MVGRTVSFDLTDRAEAIYNELQTKSIQARTILWYLAFFGLAIDYMNRISLNIAIVQMVTPKGYQLNVTTNNETDSVTHSNISIYDNTFTTNTTMIGDTVAMSEVIKNEALHLSWERCLLNALNIEYVRNGFDWNEQDRARLLGAFYWIHWSTQIPGGILARKYGTKLVFGLATLITSLATFLLPICAYIDFHLILILRIFIGIVSGLLWPALYHIIGKWIPPNERGKFLASSMGTTFGVALFYPIFGFIMSIMSWEWVFYMCGCIGTIWYLCWQYFVYDTPNRHPRIDRAECRFIEISLNNQDYQGPIPWLQILGSRGVWMNCIAQFGSLWCLFTILTQSPTYFKYVHNLNMGLTGVLIGIPYISKMLFGYLFSLFADSLLSANILSRTNVRKLAVAVTCFGQGIFVVGISVCGTNSYLATLFYTLTVMLHGATSVGIMASLVDLSPNFTSITLAIVLLFAVPTGYMSANIVSWLNLDNQTLQSWQNVFLIAGGIVIASGIMHVLFSVSELQSWNAPKSVRPVPEQIND